jgi:hypothetical protein
MIVAAVEGDQVRTHLSSEEGSQVVEKLVSTFLVVGHDLFDSHIHLLTFEVI